MIFLVLSGNMMFLFPENIILFFRRKMKDDLSQEIHGILIFFSNTPKKWSFQKKIMLKYDLSCIIRKDDISFSRKYDIFCACFQQGVS